MLTKEENDRINALLRQEQEYNSISEACTIIHEAEFAIKDLQEIIKISQEQIKQREAIIETQKAFILDALNAVEEKTGYSKMPLGGATVYLRTVAEKIEVSDHSAVPPEYQIMKPHTDKKKLNEAISQGLIAKDSNWLKVIPEHKTVCFK